MLTDIANVAVVITFLATVATVIVKFLWIPSIKVVENTRDDEDAKKGHSSAYGWIKEDEKHFALFLRLKIDNRVPLPFFLQQLIVHYNGRHYEPQDFVADRIALRSIPDRIEIGKNPGNEVGMGRLDVNENVIRYAGRKISKTALVMRWAIYYLPQPRDGKIPASLQFNLEARYKYGRNYIQTILLRSPFPSS